MKNRWQRLSIRERLLAGVAGIIMLVVLLCYGVIGPYLSHTQALENGIAHKAIRLEKSLRQVSRESHIEHRLSQLRHRYQEVVAHLIPGTTPSLAAARLQEHLQNIATQSEIQIVTVKVLPDEQVREFQRTSVQLMLRGDMPAVAMFLAEMEYDSWWMTIERLDIRASRRRRRRRRRLARYKMRPPLTVTVVIGGFIRGSAPTVMEKNEA